MKVAFTLNDQAAAWQGPPVTRLAQALRDDLGLTGTKVGCDAGDCGACTVLLNGRQTCACLVAMGQVEGRRIETVEGLGDDTGGLTGLFPACAAMRHLHAGRGGVRTACLGNGCARSDADGVLCRCSLRQDRRGQRSSQSRLQVRRPASAVGAPPARVSA